MRFWRRLGRISPPLVVGLGGLLLWELTLRVVQPGGFVLPPPSDILSSAVENREVIWTAVLSTGWIVITGLISGVVIGVMLSLAVSWYRLADEAITPLAVAISAIPIIALAPIFNAWFGLLSPRSNQLVVVLLVFFPIFINTTRGLTDIPPDQIDLMRSYGASRWEITKEVRVPNAMPFFFSALRISASLAVIAAIVAEYFGGRQDALGPLIIQNAGLARYTDAWAAVLAGSLMGIGLFAIVRGLERFAMPWQVAVNQGIEG
jgi:NitT/TauT family transport system permease protein